MSDSAVGPISGFLFQFEKALLILSRLTNPNDAISVEEVDDIAVHDEETPDKILFAYQAKHSLSLSGSTFEDSSKALWRTLELWIQKYESGVFGIDTQFICSTNKVIPSDALIRKIITCSFEETEKLIKALQQKMKAAQAEKKKSGKPSPHITSFSKSLNTRWRRNKYSKVSSVKYKLKTGRR